MGHVLSSEFFWTGGLKVHEANAGYIENQLVRCKDEVASIVIRRFGVARSASTLAARIQRSRSSYYWLRIEEKEHGIKSILKKSVVVELNKTKAHS